MISKKLLVVGGGQTGLSFQGLDINQKYEIINCADGLKTLEMISQNHGDIAGIMLDYSNNEYCCDQIATALDGDEYRSIPVFVIASQSSSQRCLNKLGHRAVAVFDESTDLGAVEQRIVNTIETIENACIRIGRETDNLTCLYNRKTFYQKVTWVLENSGPIQYDMVFVNVRGFKTINDIYGVYKGDDFLKTIALKMRDWIVKIQGLCARFNSDNFYALIPRQDGNIEAFVNDLERHLEELKLHHKISFNYGIYQIDDSSLHVQKMCDFAVAAAKISYCDFERSVAYYDQETKERMQEEMLLVEEFEKSLIESNFDVYYQTKYDLFDETIVGAEALVRWRHPQLGMITPQKFIPLFERNGFISRLDFHIWDKVGKFIRDWIDSGNQPFPISVNISRVDFLCGDLVERLENILNKYDLPCELLHLEITETFGEIDPELLAGVVTRLKQRGFLIEIDDFGSGYSSLNMIEEIPADILKLDMRFLLKKKTIDTTVAFVVDLARSLKMKVVAEGVETLEELEILKDIGCEYGQGFYFTKPLPQEEFVELMKVSISKGGSKNQVLYKNKRINDCRYNSIPYGIIEFKGADLDLNYINKKACEIIGDGNFESSISRISKIEDLIISDNLEKIHETMATKKYWAGEIEIITSTNDKRTCHSTIHKIIENSEVLTHVILIA